ncbi:hypothetical protein HGH92_24740 [Chitinophaga varians]|uniref:Uncharacterized protein n=1 Tax=Chitinophaga varians TaxID=2202339 RepID=A0A847S276_9BACT|nr:hypothetical protein [Chitinophaga varians]NLR67535.1 hypothetical protein [Chitinophaga varians]
MKKLEKLVPKEVTSPETLKGGLMQLQCLEDGDKTTSNSASWNGRHYVTDTKAD